MKIKYCVLMLALFFTFIFTGCQATTKSLGSSMTIKLEPNQKLEMITWKDDSLWYLTRPMTENDSAETHEFQESSNIGILEGTVTIIETKED